MPNQLHRVISITGACRRQILRRIEHRIRMLKRLISKVLVLI